MPQSKESLARVRKNILDRWGPLDWHQHYPWWNPPAKVRVLVYADGPVQFNGGSFNGLQYVYTLLKTRAYFYVDFDVQFAHRAGTDPTATISGAVSLIDLDIVNKFDEVWFFGFNPQQGSSINPGESLSAQELTLLTQFMSAPKSGGVLVTGDHASLGQALAGQIPRAGQMRQYPAPFNNPPGYNTTVEEGDDANTTFDFDDQSDDVPQTIRWKQYSLAGLSAIRRNSRPHPVLCGPDGPINVLPDHEHEGEALAPVPAANDPQWPSKNGHQEAPDVIAWGKIKDPSATKFGQEIGVISAYNGHNVDVGRIVADSTWHHWFDINLTGIDAPPSPYAGFVATPAGQAALKKIDAYYLNTGVWLAPPDKQAEMRNAGWWAILWTDRVAELSPNLPLRYLGEQAIDALGRWAPRCTASEWIFDWPIFKEKIPRWEWPMLFEKFQLLDLPIEKYVAGGVLRRLMIDLGPANQKLSFPSGPPNPKELTHSISRGVEEGLADLAKQLHTEARLAHELAESAFDLRKSR